MESPRPLEDFTIRAATVPDIPVLVRHRCEMFKDMGQLREDSYSALAQASARFFERAIPGGEYFAWLVAPADNATVIVAGGGAQLRSTLPRPSRTGGLQPNAPQALIVNVFTENEWRRCGLAEMVMRTILDWCTERGIGSVVLHASEMGRPLYERLGFLPTNEMYLPV